MDFQNVVVFGGLVGALYMVSMLKEQHERKRVVPIDKSSRRAVDPVTVDKATSTSYSNNVAAPQNLRGLYAGTGSSQRNKNEVHAERTVVQPKDGRVENRLANVKKQVDMGKGLSNRKVTELFGQGRPVNIGNDYKPITARLKGMNSVSIGMAAAYRRMQDTLTGPQPETDPFYADYQPIDHVAGHQIGFNTINKQFGGIAPKPVKKTNHILNAKSYEEFLNMTGHRSQFHSEKGEQAESGRSRQIYL